MAVVKIKKDQYGFYVRHAGCIFRPLFPIGYNPNNPEINIEEGMDVRVRYKGAGASYAKVRINDECLFWMNHGSYIVPNGDEIIHRKSYDCILVSTIPESING